MVLVPIWILLLYDKLNKLCQCLVNYDSKIFDFNYLFFRPVEDNVSSNRESYHGGLVQINTLAIAAVQILFRPHDL